MQFPDYQLIQYFQNRPYHEGPLIAKSLVEKINEALYENRTTIQIDQAWDTDLTAIALQIPVQPFSISQPWQAYNASQLPIDKHIGPITHTDSIEAILATIPSSYRNVSSIPDIVTASNEESVLQYLGSLIRDVVDELVVIAPYWSVSGVDHLIRHASSNDPFVKKITLLTPNFTNQEDQDGCDHFKRWASSEGAEIEHWVPSPDSNGYLPLVHAKLIIADSNRGYIGSANISENGLARSIEFGLGVRGPIVRHISIWFQSLLPNLKIFECL